MADTIKDEEENGPKIWYHQQTIVLKRWGEIASSYRFIHNQLKFSWRRWSIAFSLPIIVLSTLTGSANFAISHFPENIQPMLPVYIGAVNIVVGVIGTISRFLRVDELTEAHGVASVGFGKLSRSIATELSLPAEERSMHGKDFLIHVRSEMDRLLEQSPDINPKVANKFNEKFNNQVFAKPEICQIEEIKVYQPTEEEKKEMEKFKQNPNLNVFDNAVSYLRMRPPSRSESAAGLGGTSVPVTPRHSGVPFDAQSQHSMVPFSGTNQNVDLIEVGSHNSDPGLM